MMKYALVVEDNQLVAMMVEEELIDHGYATIDVATSQEQAIEYARIRCPDLITVDDKLDSGTGVETIMEICRDQAIPVVFITAAPDAVKAVFPEAIIIPKPFSRPQIAAAIEAAVQTPMMID